MEEGKREPDQLILLKNLLKPTREERSAQMNEEILSVEGAARALGDLHTDDLHAGPQWRYSRDACRPGMALYAQQYKRVGGQRQRSRPAQSGAR